MSTLNFDEFTDKLRRQIADAEIERVVKQLFDLLEPLENEVLHDIVILKNKMVRLRSEELRGGLSYAEAEHSRTQICNNLLSVLHIMEKDAKILEHFNNRYLHLIPTLGPDKILARLTTDDSRVNRPIYELKSNIIIGRQDTCEIVVNELRVSRQHARLFIQDDTLLIQDMGSRNKTFINGIEVTTPTVVNKNGILNLYNVYFNIDLL